MNWSGSSGYERRLTIYRLCVRILARDPRCIIFQVNLLKKYAFVCKDQKKLKWPIKIKLNVTLSAAQNAENYYRKSKNYSKEVAYWQSNVDKKNQEIIRIQEQISAVELTETRKVLKSFMSILTQAKKPEIEGNEIPFKQFEVDGWVIWVGKSAKNNDLLTLKYAKKFDLWLHARDVAGSHVIIRNPNQKVVPKYVVEKAAGLAAYFSKRQSDSLCPVIVTPKKYVRKTKDLLAGQMIVDREEEVVLIKPELIE